MLALQVARREVIPVYPTAAVREPMLDALAHLDYGLSGATVDVTIWDDRLEVRSPGGLPGHLTVDNIRHEHYFRNRQVSPADALAPGRYYLPEP